MDIKLKQSVILGYSDINSSGLYVVSGVEETCIVEHQTYQFNMFENTSDADNEGKKLEIKIDNTKDKSFVKIQELPPQNKIVYLADALINLFCQNEVNDVIIVSSINFSINDESVYLGCLPDNEAKNYEKLKKLSPTFKLRDHFFNTMITLLKVEKIRTRCLVFPGKKIGARERKSNSSHVYEVGILRLLVEGLKEIVPDVKISMDKVLDTKVKKDSLYNMNLEQDLCTDELKLKYQFAFHDDQLIGNGLSQGIGRLHIDFGILRLQGNKYHRICLLRIRIFERLNIFEKV
ncbi:6236_t:CDS:2 [Dentiscutata heterogama]|uniref:6236_t:CDS:1 n=1 Tax=Dentiscutata heterogama TaxID=1316150 RepID=A0ACA9MH59_9GLOM|nr:6236_t:CDS:2 [Dentiscutata heterogama]